MPEPSVVPVTILTGALGAGKTTLLRRILTEEHGLRIAVVENEFADEEGLGVESLVLRAGGPPSASPAAPTPASLAGFYELSNGCLCCSQRDGLADALARILRARAQGSAPVDLVLIETSGLADAGAVARSFWTDAAEAQAGAGVGGAARLALDGVLAVVDAAHFAAARRRARPAGAANEVERQVACADVLLLNKMDLVGGAASPEAAAVHAQLRAINAAADIVPCTACDVPLARLLGLAAYGGGGGAGVRHVDRVLAAAGEGGGALACADGGACGEHAHDGVSSWVWRQPPLARPTRRAFRLWLGALLWEKRVAGAAAEPVGVDVFRVKGAVWLRDDGTDDDDDDDDGGGGGGGGGGCDADVAAGGALQRLFIVQGVHDVFELQAVRGAALAREAGRPGALVLIGLGVSAAAGQLAAGLGALNDVLE